MSLEKPAAVAADPVESAKWDKLTAGHARSSPRVRGTVSRAAREHALAGIIPARAGSSNSKSARGLIARDHPHVCGEQTPRLLVARYRSGSSPRVRGTEGEYCVDEVVHGIIPAYVGAVGQILAQERADGITPAYAGSSH